MKVREWKKQEAAVNGGLELLEPTVPATLRITETEVFMFDGDGRRLARIVWASGGRDSVGHAEIWNSKMRCDQTARIPEVTTF